ncbi:hypothetical protein D9M72_389410 [compost metagenome]
MPGKPRCDVDELRVRPVSIGTQDCRGDGGIELVRGLVDQPLFVHGEVRIPVSRLEQPRIPQDSDLRGRSRRVNLPVDVSERLTHLTHPAFGRRHSTGAHFNAVGRAGTQHLTHPGVVGSGGDGDYSGGGIQFPCADEARELGGDADLFLERVIARKKECPVAGGIDHQGHSACFVDVGNIPRAALPARRFGWSDGRTRTGSRGVGVTYRDVIKCPCRRRSRRPCRGSQSQGQRCQAGSVRRVPPS